MRKAIIGLAAVVTIGILGVAFSGEYSDYVLKSKAKEAVLNKLKDPDSAKFGPMTVRDDHGTPVVCGTVNSKNGFGGFTGYTVFFVEKTEVQVALPHTEDVVRKIVEHVCPGFIAKGA